MVAHALNPRSWEAKAGRSEFEAGLFYKANSRTGRTQRKPISKKGWLSTTEIIQTQWKVKNGVLNENWIKTEIKKNM